MIALDQATLGTVADNGSRRDADNRRFDSDQIQGNIIGFNKPFQTFLFLRFPLGGRKRVGAWLGDRADETTTGSEVLRFRAFRKKEREHGRTPQATWRNLAFTHTGLRRLDFPSLGGFPVDFRQGMAKRAEAVGDVGANAPENWEFNKGGGQLDAVLLLAADTPDDLEAEVARQCDALREAGIALVYRQDGADRAAQPRREHFGFKDGVSQPDLRDGGIVLDQPRPPLPAWTVNGSYLVFRRLRQDVAGFRKFVRESAGKLYIGEDLLMAKLVGRYPNGLPLAADTALLDPHAPAAGVLGYGNNAQRHQRDLPDDQPLNDFCYGDDPDGRLVPRAAHIRKVNPRDQLADAHELRTRRILRRGLPFGHDFREEEADREPQGGPPFPHDRGLLFLSYQQSIAEQFEFVQRQWANDPNFPEVGRSTPPGHDPIIGQPAGPRAFELPGSPDGALNPLPQWVTMTGGDYFFSPAIHALKLLADYLRGERDAMEAMTASQRNAYLEPIYINNAGSGLCTVLITVGIGSVPGIEPTGVMWRLPWSILVRDTPVWWSNGYDGLCVTEQGTLVGKAEVPVRRLLEALPSALTVGEILRLTDPNAVHDAVLDQMRRDDPERFAVIFPQVDEIGYERALRLEVTLNGGRRISLPINMGVSTW